MEYTREQKQAMCSDRNISVMANAGSGKTFILIDRYIDIILNDERVNQDPRKILAITFTKNAAGEMKARATKKIESLIKAEKNEKNLKALYKIRERLSYANISTIHSFCSALLRDYPIEAGILPNFNDLDDAEKIKIQNDAIAQTIDEMLFNGSPEDKENFQSMIARYGYNKISSYIAQILQNRELMLGMDKFYASPIEDLDIFYHEELVEVIREIIEKYLDMLSDTPVFLPPDADDLKLTIAMESLNSCASRLVFAMTLKDLNDIFNSISVIMKSKINLNATLNSSMTYSMTGNNPKIISDYKSLTKLFKEVKDLEIFSILAIQDSFMMNKLASIALQKTAELKAEMNGIDFDDMLFLARDILQIPEIAAAVQKKYVHVLIDEFQDTNDLQYDIAKALVPSLAGDMNTDVKAFIVGDAKQSIYGFRNADVRVFKKAIEDINKMNNELIDKGELTTKLSVSESLTFKANKQMIETETPDEYFGNLKLTSSFRLKPAVAGFVNSVMQPLMNLNETDYDVKYDALVYGRDAEFYLDELSKLPADANGDKEIDRKFGSISILTYVKPYEDKKSEADSEDSENNGGQDESIDELHEAAKVAEYIEYIVSEGSDFTIGDREPKLANYGDISILARSRTKFPPLIKSLIACKIPFVVHSGSGFYAAPEISDTIEFLKFLHNQSDDLALITILRSPYFAFDINELYSLSMEEGLSWFDKLTNYAAKQSGGKANKYIRAVRILAELQFYAVKVTIAALLGKIYEIGGWISYAAGTNIEKQTLANLDKLTALARSFESKGFRTLYDFVEYLDLLRENSTEAEAVTVTGSNAVNILTIHASKGQEYPIVILYNTNSRNTDKDSLKIDDKYGIAFKSMVEDGNGVVYEAPSIPLFLAKKKSGQADNAEEKRILYVAMTRAKDHLIITASLKANKPAENEKVGPIAKLSGYFENIVNALEIDKDLFHIKNFSRKLEVNLPVYSSDNIPPMKFVLPVYINPIVINPSLANETEIENMLQTAVTDDIAEIKPALSGYEGFEVLEGFHAGEFMDEMFSASKLLNYIDHENEYEEKYVLGFNKFKNQNSIFSIDPLNQTEETHGMSVGTVIHEIFENINEWLDDDCKIKRRSFDAIVEKKLTIAEKKTDGLLRERINSECAAVSSTKLIHQHRKALQTAIAEKSMMIPVGNFFLQGAIDIMIEGADGQIEVWDWKSNHIESAEILEKWKKHYQLQMEIYVYFLSFLYPDYNSYSARLLFTNAAKPDAENDTWTVLFEFSKADIPKIGEKIETYIKKANFMDMLGIKV